MRRSGAPSQLGKVAKRPRFTPPILGTRGDGGGGGGGNCSPITGHLSATPALMPNKQALKISSSTVESCSDDHSATTANSGRTVKDILNLIHTKTHTENEQKPSPPGLESNELTGTENCSEEFSVEAQNILTTTYITQHPGVSTNNDVSINSETRGPDTFPRKGFATPVFQKQFSEQSHSADSCLNKGKFQSFKTPVQQGVQHTTESGTRQYYGNPEQQASQSDLVKTGNDPSDQSALYFNVMWCKRSKKKHKKWEGDAILVTKGRSATLLDMEGKEIGKSTGYKTSELRTLAEGHTLVIGGKEIEVMSTLSEELFLSGKCFQGAAISADPSPPRRKTSSGLSKPFCKPQKDGSVVSSTAPVCTKTGELLPRHDPTIPGALVLPRPPQSHQWERNKEGLPLLDVVVDPYLSQHLRPHQREGVLFLYECVMGMKHYNGLGAILADEMGLGKTLQCISLIWTLLKQGPYGGKPVIKKILIITPGSLVKNWVREFKKWLGTERINVFAVGSDNRAQNFTASNRHPVMAISYEMFVRSFDVLSNLTFDLIVCDEGHRLKNTNIKTTTMVQSLATRRRVVLSGTPVQNDLQELFAIVDFCNPGILGSASAFRRVYEEPILASRQPSASPADIALGETRASELNRLTSMFILRRTQDINNKYLPPKVELVLFCQPSDLQLSLYKHLLSSRTVRSCITCNDTATHLTCISALRKLCNHPALLYANAREDAEDNEQVEAELYTGLKKLYPAEFDPCKVMETDSGKLHALVSLLQELHRTAPRERIVLVSNYTQTLDILEQVCRRHSYQFLRLDGQTPTAKRQQLVERFNSRYSEDFVFLLSSKAGGVGLNLIGASRLVLYDVDWNPANDLQAMARVWRDGQRNRVYIYRLLTTGTIEEKMYQRQISKQGLSGVVVDAKTNNKMHFSPTELRDLFRVQENIQCATHTLLDCQCDFEDGHQRAPDVPADTSKTRPCQLQQTAVNKKQTKNLCMDELLEWHHVPRPDLELQDVDECIPEGGLPAVTFAFWNEANKTQIDLSTADS